MTCSHWPDLTYICPNKEEERTGMVQSVEIFDLNVGFAPVQHFIMQKVSICEITKKNTEDKTRKIQHLDFSPKVYIGNAVWPNHRVLRSPIRIG